MGSTADSLLHSYVCILLASNGANAEQATSIAQAVSSSLANVADPTIDDLYDATFEAITSDVTLGADTADARKLACLVSASLLPQARYGS